jgi:hypothetical protein
VQRDKFYQRDPVTGTVPDIARFVHYTSAEAALNINKTKRVWMRKAMSMSDYREVQHGFDILNRFFRDESKMATFTTALDECAAGAAAEGIRLFNQHWNTTRFQTYIASISEHLSEENMHGRRSMWRAFGGNTARVALVFNIPWNAGGGRELGLLFSPVCISTGTRSPRHHSQGVENIHANQDFLRSLEPQVIASYLFVMLLAGVTCLKHEGFREEREWRPIYSPHRSPSPLMKGSTEVVGAVPQIVYNIPLDEKVSPALAGLEFTRIFDRLIISPSPYAWPMYEAFTAALTEAGIPKEGLEQRVHISGIPIRA